ncbi:MAG TPA: hypothetical protein VNA25_14015 [Phycisphaerae bacterium]|nr:hypothetical protein [Phycisphaerae bacterium]
MRQKCCRSRSRSLRHYVLPAVMLAMLFTLAGCKAERLIHADPPARYGIHEGSPALSHDGRTLVWFHREDEKAFLCVLKSPWDKPPQQIEVHDSGAFGHIDPVQLSGDGRHAFVNGQHVEILEGEPVARGTLPGVISYFGVAPSFDGSRVAAPSDAKDGGLKLLSREGAHYVKAGMFTPPGNRQPAMWPRISGDGKLVVYELGDDLYEAALRDGVWKKRAVAFGLKITMTPLAMSADGQTLLLRGFKRNAERTAENLYLSSRDARGRWQKPKLLLDNARHSVYNCSMSPDAQTVVWVNYTRDGQGDITRTRLQFMRRQGDGWTEPSTILDIAGGVQFMNIALSNADVLAYAVADRSKPPGSCTIFLRPDLKPETQAVNINQRMGSLPEKVQQAGTGVRGTGGTGVRNLFALTARWLLGGERGRCPHPCLYAVTASECRSANGREVHAA